MEAYNKCGLKSHAELIQQALIADKKLMVLALSVSGFTNKNSQFMENYKYLKIALFENYTSLRDKLLHIRKFNTYNKERLQLEQRILSSLSKLRTPTFKNCEEFNLNQRVHLNSMLTETNIEKLKGLGKAQNL